MAAALGGLLCASVGRAQTVAITGLYTTGVRADGTLLGNNASDAHYVVTAIPAGAPSNNLGTSRTVKTSAIPGAWTPNTSTARWITTPGDSTAGGGTANTGGNNPSRVSGLFDYTLTFSMPSGGLLSNVSIAGTGSADDTTQIYVNGILVSGQATATYSSAGNFTLDSSNATFVSGSNTITFRVNNSGGGPSGLLISSLGGSVDIPEVGAWLPAFTAVALYGAMTWRRRDGLVMVRVRS